MLVFYELKIIFILQGVTYKRTVAKEQGPYHESCGLCGPNILVGQRYQFVVPYDKVSDVVENHMHCAFLPANFCRLIGCTKNGSR